MIPIEYPSTEVIANYGAAASMLAMFATDYLILRPKRERAITKERKDEQSAMAAERSAMLLMFTHEHEKDREIRHETNAALNTLGLAVYSLKELFQASKRT